MLIRIDENSTVPNYQQIQIQIKEMILHDQLSSDEQLPSIRSLASSLNIAVITIKRAYEELEKEGIVYTKSGKGVFVCHVDKSKIKNDIKIQLKNELSNIMKYAKRFNFTLEEVKILLEEIDHE